jgi:hypothetical protein
VDSLLAVSFYISPTNPVLPSDFEPRCDADIVGHTAWAKIME